MSYYYNKIGLDNYLPATNMEKLVMLLKSGAFDIGEDFDLDFVLDEINGDNLEGFYEFEKFISSRPFLKPSRLFLKEIYYSTFEDLKNNPNQLSHLGIELMEDYKLMLYSTYDVESKRNLIKDYLEKTVRELNDYCFQNFYDFFSINEDFNKEMLFEIMEHFYENLIHYDEDDLLFLDEAIKDLNLDVINYLSPGGPDFISNAFITCSHFVVLNDLINVRSYFINELKKLDSHKHIEEISHSNFSIVNVENNFNRFPKVFKDAYCCELFFYLLSFENKDNKILFSYYFELFSQYKYLKKNIVIGDFLRLLKNCFGIEILRLRKNNLSNKKYNSVLKSFIDNKKRFDEEQLQSQ